MYFIDVHKTIDQIFSILYFIGIWQNNNCNRMWCLRIWYLASYGYIVTAIAVGALTTNNESEVVFLAVLSIVAFVVHIRLYIFLWKKDEILGFIRKMGVHSSIRDVDEFNRVNDKINFFIKFVFIFEAMLLCAVTTMAVIALPFFTNERRLPLNYYFPFNWQDNLVLYVIAYIYVTYGLMFTCFCTLFNEIIWYLMISCGIKYQILGNEFRHIGADNGQQDPFLLELITLIKKHKQLQE